MHAATQEAQQHTGPPYEHAESNFHQQHTERTQDQQEPQPSFRQEQQPAAVTSGVAALEQHYGQPQYLLGSQHAFEFADEQSSDAQQQVSRRR